MPSSRTPIVRFWRDPALKAVGSLAAMRRF